MGKSFPHQVYLSVHQSEKGNMTLTILNRPVTPEVDETPEELNPGAALEDGVSKSVELKLILLRLPAEIKNMILEELLVQPVAIEPCLCYTDQHGIMIDEEIFYYEWSENPLRYKATRDLSRNSTTLQDVHISWQMDLQKNN